MSCILKQFSSKLTSIVPFSTLPLYCPVRFRYHADKIAKGPLLRDWGYEERIFKRGQLPRIKDAEPLPLPEYKPKNSWTEKRALKGQNDYIDLLGNHKLHPTRVSYDVPGWLRGVQGKEYQLLLRKKKMLQRGIMPVEQPSKWKKIEKRITYLYKYLNQKTKTGYIKRE